jgi:hypothetical protein
LEVITLKKIIKALWYGKFAEYHLNKAKKYIEYKNVRDYHFELAQHYHKIAYGDKSQ